MRQGRAGRKALGRQVSQAALLALAFGWGTAAAAQSTPAPAQGQSTTDAGPAAASDTPATDPRRADENVMETVVVTARRRAERLQDVPASITAFTGSNLRELGIRDISQLSLQTPGFSLQNASRQTEQPFIRGIAVNSVFRDLQNASFFIDGIYVAGVGRTTGIDDVDRIEVILGPQSAVFGRATFAGAINYITKKPTDKFEADFLTQVGEHGLFDASGSVSGPINDKLSARLYYQHHEYQGEYKNGLDGRQLGTEQTNGFSGSLRWTIVPEAHVTARLQYTEFRDGNSATQTLFAANVDNCRPNAAGVFQFHCGEIFAPTSVSLNLNSVPFGGFRHTNQFRSSLFGDWTFWGGYTLNATLAYNSERAQLTSDGDGTPINTAVNLNNFFQTKYYDDSADVRFSSPVNQRLRWYLGVYAFRSARDESSQLLPTVIPARIRDVRDYAGYGSAAFDILSNLTLTFDGRYQDETTILRKTAYHATFDKFLPRVVLSYKPKPDFLIYGSYSEGDKPGTFNAGANVPLNLVVVQEEGLENYEVGLKTSWFNHRLTANVTGYYIDWQNQSYQQTVFQQNAAGVIVRNAAGSPLTTVVSVSAGNSHVKGVEADATLQILRGWSARAAYSYTDSEYSNFNSTLPLVYGGATQVAGNYLPNTPLHKVIFSTLYRRSLSNIRRFEGWDAIGEGDIEIRGRQYLDELNTAYIGQLNLLNGRIGVENERYRFELYARNILDSRVPDFATRFQDYSSVGFRNSYQTTLRPSRAVGFTFTYKTY